MIACQRDEPRYIGDQDVFALQGKVIENILSSEREREARAVAPTAVDPSQQAIREEFKNAIQRGGVDREAAKSAIRYLAQPMGRFAVKRLKAAYKEWSQAKDDPALLEAVSELAQDFAKETHGDNSADQSLQRDDLELICFDYLSS